MKDDLGILTRDVAMDASQDLPVMVFFKERKWRRTSIPFIFFLYFGRTGGDGTLDDHHNADGETGRGRLSWHVGVPSGRSRSIRRIPQARVPVL